VENFQRGWTSVDDAHSGEISTVTYVGAKEEIGRAEREELLKVHYK
jgi:hypothetical protein